MGCRLRSHWYENLVPGRNEPVAQVSTLPAWAVPVILTVSLGTGFGVVPGGVGAGPVPVGGIGGATPVPLSPIVVRPGLEALVIRNSVASLTPAAIGTKPTVT